MRRLLFFAAAGAAFAAHADVPERIVFGRIFPNAGQLGLFAIVKPDGTGFRELTSGPNNNGFPSLSPDGQRFAYRSFGPDGDGLKVMQLETSAVTTLVSGYTDSAQPYGELFVMRYDGTEVQQLTDNQWEDGRRVGNRRRRLRGGE